ncbi:MAG: putative bifunctional diguanylate cyclase/phosphodiesterase [Nitrospiria bacterium]
MPIRILIVEDSEDDATLLVCELQRGGYDPVFKRVDTESAMKAALEEQIWDVVVSDYTMPHFNGLKALLLVQKYGLDLPFIIMSGSIGEDIAVACMKSGAHDYIMKDKPARLIPAIERELDEAKIRQRRREAESMNAYLAYYDALTALPNRTLFQDRLKQAISVAERENKTVAVLLMDLDRFKEINDTLGHQSGDLVLQQVGLRLRTILRESDTVARLGGDEFGVVLTITKNEDAKLMALKIIKILEQSFLIQNIHIAVEVSIGIALYPDHGTEVNILLQRADVAMYAAKETGSGHKIYMVDRDRHNARKLSLLGELRDAINTDLCLHYQPIIDIKTNKVTGLEALVRWQHPQHGMIPPDQFIMPAEQTGLIAPLTRWVLQEATRQCRELHLSGLKISLAVNLSVRSLQDPQLPRQITEILETSGLEPSWLELEITESAIMINHANALKVMDQLHDVGVKFSIDDFGTGYTSLGYLTKLPIESVKIDKSFVMGMTTNDKDQVVVRSTIDLGHNLGLKVIAEGVENLESWNQLASFGCDAAQGYYMSRPLPTMDLARWLNDSTWGFKLVPEKLKRKQS